MTAVQVLLGTGREGTVSNLGTGAGLLFFFFFFYTSNLNSKGVHLNKTFEISCRETLNTLILYENLVLFP